MGAHRVLRGTRHRVEKVRYEVVMETAKVVIAQVASLDQTLCFVTLESHIRARLKSWCSCWILSRMNTHWHLWWPWKNSKRVGLH